MYISYFVSACCTLNHLMLLDRFTITVIRYNGRKLVLFSFVGVLISALIVLNCHSIANSLKQRPSSESRNPHLHNISHTFRIT
jgi:hypothetical protein